jgi:PAS domain S-box-containing protein
VHRFFRPSRISTKLIIGLLVFSAVVTLCIFSVQLYIEYRKDMNLIHKDLAMVEKSHLPPMINAVWVSDQTMIMALLEGITSHRDISYAAITKSGNIINSVGSSAEKNVMTRSWPLSYAYKGHVRKLGSLEVQANLAGVYSRLYDQAVVILASQAVKTFLTTGFLLFLIHSLLTRHIVNMSSQAKRIKPGKAGRVSLDRKNRMFGAYDELDELAESLNTMARELNAAYQDMEQRVNERTAELIAEVKSRTQAEEALKESEERFRTVLEKLPGAVFVHDLKGSLVLVNETACHNTGYSKDELLNMSVYDIDPLARGDEFQKRFWQKLEHAQSVTVESKHIRKDGSVYIAEIHITAITLGGHPVILPIVFDVTQRKEIENALAASEHRFRSIIEDASNLAIQGFDANRRIVFWNRASAELYGYSHEEALGQRWDDLVVPEHMCDETVSSIDSWLEKGDKIPAGEFTRRDKWGRAVPVFSSYVLYEPTPGRVEVFCFDIDLTEVKRMQAELVNAKEQAEAANRAKSEFLANMSHEIRTPLNGILGMLQLMKMTDLNAEQHEYVDMASTSSKRLNRLLGDILDLSKIEADKMEVRNEVFHIPEVMQAIQDIFTHIVRQNENSLIITTDERIPEKLFGDSTRLTQILFNLAGNASKYTRKGHVEVEAVLLDRPSIDSCQVLFTVSDNGPGIPDDRLDQVFETFAQGRDSNSPYARQQEGVGLGLPLVKRFVDLMGGTLCIDSMQGNGTAVYVSFCFDVVHSAQDVLATDEGVETQAMQRSSILLAEDDYTTQIYMRHFLKEQGMDVDVVENGEEALSELSRRHFDCVLMDIQMPVLDGVETTRRIRAMDNSYRDIPIIALTAYAMNEDREKFLSLGMDDYIAKPIDQEELLLAIQRNILRGAHR